MPHRKLVQIGQTPQLPTIAAFFSLMAQRQGEEIERLKAEILGEDNARKAPKKTAPKHKPVPDPWLLHPVKVKRAPAKRQSRTIAKKAHGTRKPRKRAAR